MMKLVVFVFLFVTAFSYAQKQPYMGWQEGDLEIHHISTGSGNATFFIFPDGTTLLFDAGDVDRQVKANNPLKISPRLPADTFSGGRSIVHYIKRVLPTITHVDYAVISHFHTDHYGNVTDSSELSKKGKYFLAGVTEVNEYIPIKQLIDRNYPFYLYPVPVADHTFDKPSFSNYLSFVNSQIEKNLLVATSLVAGSKTQIVQKIDPVKFSNFVVRNIKANGEIWSGRGNETLKILPDKISLREYNENPLSLALKISYGKFDYFTGGDMTGVRGFGLPEWFDTETPVAKVVGKVEALSLNHHGVRDASNHYFLKTLAPSVIIQQSWSSNHPGEEVLHRLFSQYTYAGKRDIFATYVHDETRVTYGKWLEENYQSQRGHIIIKVMPSTVEFFVYIINDTLSKLETIDTFGPYHSH